MSHPPTVPSAFLTARFAEAITYASSLHSTQVRKGTRVPYVAHLLGVASLVLEGEGDEDMAIAGLLHDAAEDQGGEVRLADIETRFGTHVADYVRACSDSLSADPTEKEPWEVRKRRYVAELGGHDMKAITVSMADKAHNARAILTDLQNGVEIFDHFKAPADRVLWYYDSCLAIGRTAGVSDRILTPLAEAIEGIRTEVAAQGAHDAS